MDSGIPAITRGIACVGKTSSTPIGPLSARDGVDRISSVTVSLLWGWRLWKWSPDLWNQRFSLVYLEERKC